MELQLINEMHQDPRLEAFTTLEGMDVWRGLKSPSGEESIVDFHLQIEDHILKHAKTVDNFFQCIIAKSRRGKTSTAEGEVKAFEEGLLAQELKRLGIDMEVLVIQTSLGSAAARLEGIIDPSLPQGTFPSDTYRELTEFTWEQVVQKMEERKLEEAAKTKRREERKAANKRVKPEDRRKVSIWVIETGSPNGIPVEDISEEAIFDAETGPIPIEGQDRLLGLVSTLAHNPDTKPHTFVNFISSDEEHTELDDEALAFRKSMFDVFHRLQAQFAAGDVDESTFNEFVQTFFENKVKFQFEVDFDEQKDIFKSDELSQLYSSGLLDKSTLFKFGKFILTTMNAPQGVITSDQMFEEHKQALGVSTEDEVIAATASRMKLPEGNMRVWRNKKLNIDEGEVPVVDLEYFGKTFFAKKHPEIIQGLVDMKAQIREKVMRPKYGSTP